MHGIRYFPITSQRSTFKGFLGLLHASPDCGDGFSKILNDIARLALSDHSRESYPAQSTLPGGGVFGRAIVSVIMTAHASEPRV
jgi:hypothetical protein